MAENRPQAAQLLVMPLLLVLGGLVWFQLRPRSAGLTMAPLAPPTPQNPTSISMEPQATSEPSSIPETMDRDPFQWPSALREAIQAMAKPVATPDATPQVETVTMPTLTVQGIFWGTTPHRAIVNDQILTEGDTIEGVRIVSIDRQGIAVEFHGTQSTLSVPTPGTATHE